MGYRLEYSKASKKDAELLERVGLDTKAKAILKILRRDPYEPPCEKLMHDLKGSYSRRINKHHRLVYDILPNTDGLKDENGELYKGIVYVLRMWTHYE
jgi:Txe/YoeB family toxin of toxin-antitoxin system